MKSTNRRSPHQASQTHPHEVAIVGARGYSGAELARLLLRHPETELKSVFATDANWSLSELIPGRLAAEVDALPISKLFERSFQTVFLATPAEVSLELAPRLLARGSNVIDLSGAFRLTPEDFKQWYGLVHSATDALTQAQYGLVPWSGPLLRNQTIGNQTFGNETVGLGNQTIEGQSTRAVLVSNPGCYATAVMMGLIPLLKAGLIAPDSLAIDAKSGTTGAGKKPAEHLLFSEVDGECLPYRVGRHQHLPEIRRYVSAFAGVAIDPPFATHLLPIRRGIIASIYARLADPRLSREQALAAVHSAYDAVYSDYELAEYGSIEARKELLSLKRVVGTARTQIAFEIRDEKLYVFSSIDNLLKGAASQAVENLNRLLDFPLSTGLLDEEVRS